MPKKASPSKKDYTANMGFEANFAHELASTFLRIPHLNRRSDYVFASSRSASPSSQDEIRKFLIEADLIDCMIAPTGQLFNSTYTPIYIGLNFEGPLAADRIALN